MNIIEPEILSTLQKAELFLLWNQEYPAQLRYAEVGDLDAYLARLGQQRHMILRDDDNVSRGWAFSFTREGERWFAIILDRMFQGQGIGTKMLERLKETAGSLNGWVVDHNRYSRMDGTPYPSPLNFYLKNGFQVVPESRLDTPSLSAVKISWTR